MSIVEIAKIEQSNGFFPEITPNIDKESLKEDISAEDQKYFLEGLVDVGDKKAKRFLDVLGNPFFALHAISEAKINYSKNGKPKDITGIIKGFKGIGSKLILRNQNLLNFSYSQALKLKKKIRE